MRAQYRGSLPRAVRSAPIWIVPSVGLEEPGDGEEGASTCHKPLGPTIASRSWAGIVKSVPRARAHQAEPEANAPDDNVRGNPLVLFIRRYRRVRVQMPTLGRFRQ